MTPEQIEQERTAFEAWLRRWAGEEPSVLVDIEGELQYKSTVDHQLFSAWLARAEQGGWIKNAKDSRPKYYGRNIVSTKLGNVFVADYDKHFCHWEMGGKIIDGVTHWQPLPQPPKGDRK